LQKALQAAQQAHALETSRLVTELDRSNKELRTEKAKATGDAHRISELQQILRDKSVVVESLSKQVHSQQRKDKYAALGHASGKNKPSVQLCSDWLSDYPD
jgi:predicted RNase H-like nuclease (RuvC/YqgF family)